MKYLIPTTLFLSITAILCQQSAHANDDDSEQTTIATAPAVVLEDQQIIIDKSRLHRKSNEITGLGKITKQDGDIDKEMVLGIRDLTRYDPGISVVEQGRGATSGYAIRGVDKNRVAIVVDGLHQAQSYLTLKSQANGGAINEIEYENIKSIELSKGSSSAEYGNGALGGAVGFVTKDAKDILSNGKDWGVKTKTAYSSKNKQFTQSVAGVVKTGDLEQLLIYTHRQGEHTRGHKAADDYTHQFAPLTGYFYRYDVSSRTPETLGRYYLVEQDCPTLDCTPSPFARANSDVIGIRKNPALTEKEQAQAEQMRYQNQYADTKSYTGIDRIHANPMEYRSQSLFYKANHTIDNHHQIGAVIEHTKQKYDISDLTLPSYYTKADVESQPLRLIQGSINAESGLAVGNAGVADDANQPLSGLVFDAGNAGKYGARYSRTRFFDENHRKNRYGIKYQYQNPAKNGLFDQATISLDRQTLNLDSQTLLARCAEYPAIEKCHASIDKPWSWSGTEHNNYQEQLTLAKADFSKLFKTQNMTHKISALAGLGKVKSSLERGALSFSFASAGYNHIFKQGHNGSFEKPYIYQRVPTTLQTGTACDNNRRDNNDCRTRTITGDQAFLAIKDHIQINDQLNLGVGVRYDVHRYQTQDDWTAVDNYRHLSYNAGATWTPNDAVVLSYRYSNGFRVPAFYEMYGVRTGASGADNELANAEFNSRTAPKPEKASNHEFGIGLAHRFGTLETSIFANRYKDLIAIGERTDTRLRDFYNLQNITLHGINVLGKIDYHSIWQRLPDGLYSNIAYNQIKVKDRHIYDGYTMTTDPVLDAIQPARLVAGIGYDEPNGKWGFNHSITYSKGKNADELTGNAHIGIHQIALPSQSSRSWYIHDLTAYANLKDHFTLRAGVYNLFNRKYSTWESVRQSSINAINQDQGTSHARYAAAGRNFVISLETKF